MSIRNWLVAALLFWSVCCVCLNAREDVLAGVYQSEVGLYVITLSLLPNGTYLAKWDADIGSIGRASGSWVVVDKEIRLSPKREEGRPMIGYLRTLLMREFRGRKALLRKEDLADADGPLPYLFLRKSAGDSREPTVQPVSPRAPSINPK